MYLENALRLTAGFVIFIVTLIGLLLNKINFYYSLIYFFISLNLIQSSFTNWCPIVWIYKKLGIKEKC
jgi:hypothetical protein